MDHNFLDVLTLFTLPHEGVVSDVKEDKGGYTKYGLSSKAHPDLDVGSLSHDEVKRVYYNRYWERGRCSDLKPPLAKFIFDSAVNCGVPSAGKWLQAAVNRSLGKVLKEDGVIGPMTVSEVNTLDHRLLILSISSLRLRHYVEIVNRYPKQAIFFKGWVNRVADLMLFIE